MTCGDAGGSRRFSRVNRRGKSKRARVRKDFPGIAASSTVRSWSGLGCWLTHRRRSGDFRIAALRPVLARSALPVGAFWPVPSLSAPPRGGKARRRESRNDAVGWLARPHFFAFFRMNIDRVHNFSTIHFGIRFIFAYPKRIIAIDLNQRGQLFQIQACRKTARWVLLAVRKGHFENHHVWVLYGGSCEVCGLALSMIRSWDHVKTEPSRFIGVTTTGRINSTATP
jgi:hypothetical protein